MLCLISHHLISRNQILGFAAHHDRWPWRRKKRGILVSCENYACALTLVWKSHQSHRIWKQIPTGIRRADTDVDFGGRWRTDVDKTIG